MSDDVTVQILTEIRDEIRATKDEVRSTNQRLDQTNQRLDQTNQRLDQTRIELKQEVALVRTELRDEMVGSEIRAATRMVELTAATRDMYAMLTGQLDLRDRVARCERDSIELKNT